MAASVVFWDFGITDSITDKHRTYQGNVVIPVTANRTGQVSDSVSGERVSAIEYYGEAEEEVNTKTYDKNLWAKAFVQAEGDEQKRVAKYIELRANQLYSENVGSISKSKLYKQPTVDTEVSGIDIVPGTATDLLLQADITRKLFSEESKLHKECEHDVLKAEPYRRNDRSIISAEMGGEAQELEKRLRAKGDMLVEKWFLQSCDAMNVYEVLLLRSGTGTDIMVKKLDSER